jgi:hypothetical protein
MVFSIRENFVQFGFKKASNKVFFAGCLQKLSSVVAISKPCEVPDGIFCKMI